MKTRLIPFLALFLFFIACNNNKSTDKVSSNDTAIISPEKTIDSQLQIEQVKEQLSNATPLSADELKALMPEQLMGATRSNLDASAAMGALVAAADYKLNDSMTIKLEVVDCSGPGGVGLFAMQYIDVINKVPANDDETTFSIIEFNGHKAFESCIKNRPGDCTFTYLSSGRFLVAISGENTGIEALKNIANTLKFN